MTIHDRSTGPGTANRLRRAIATQGAIAKRLNEENRSLQAQLDTARGEVADFRCLLASSYSGAMLYRDDGELQDNSVQPFIDFKRDSVELIISKVQRRLSDQLQTDKEVYDIECNKVRHHPNCRFLKIEGAKCDCGAYTGNTGNE